MEGAYVNAWLHFNVVEIILSALILAFSYAYPIFQLAWLVVYIVIRITTRIAASYRCKKAHFI